MSDFAFYAQIDSIRPIPKADRIQVAVVMGYEVVTSKDTAVGDRGILIIEGAQVDQGFALAHGLLRNHPETGEKLEGYLDDNRRVRAMRLRGQKSEGIFISMAVEDSQLGLPADGVAVKYETPAQHRARAQANAKPKPPQLFPMHYETAKLRHAALDLLRPGLDRIAITEKLHGTSGRTASVRHDQSKIMSFACHVWNALVCTVDAPIVLLADLLALLSDLISRALVKVGPRYELISGTRRTILDPNATGEKGMAYRQDVHDAMASIVHDGERWYYEIVGFGDNGRPIMPPHDGELYSYGCDPDGDGLGDRFKIFVYRVVDAEGRELGYGKVSDLIDVRCGLDSESMDVVPFIRYIFADDELEVDDPKTALMELAKSYSDGFYSSLDPAHIREGVCLRSEDENGFAISPAVKYKSFEFCRREGIRANDDEFIDPEDIA